LNNGRTNVDKIKGFLLLSPVFFSCQRNRPSGHRPSAPLRETCEECGKRLWVAYHSHRKVMTFHGLWQLTAVIRQCSDPSCSLYHVRYHPEEEGHWALPHGEFGLDLIAKIGVWRFIEHRSVPEMHQRLLAAGISITEREVTHLMHRYEELVTLHITNQQRLKPRLQEQARVLLAIDGLQPDVGHEVLWVIRDCLSGEILLARTLLSSTHPQVAQRDAYLATTAPDNVSVLCQILSWSYIQEARSKRAV